MIPKIKNKYENTALEEIGMNDTDKWSSQTEIDNDFGLI